MLFVFAGFLLIFALRANSQNRQLFTLQVSNTQLQLEKLAELDKNISAEKALQHSQILWQQIVETAKDIIIRADKSGRVLYVNKIAEQITGYAKSEIINMVLRCQMQLASVLISYRDFYSVNLHLIFKN